MSLNGGNLDEIYDAGTFSESPVAAGGVDISFSNIINNTGNTYSEYVRGRDSFISYTSGDSYRFYKVNLSNSARSNVDFINGFKIFPSTIYNFYDKINNIIYTKNFTGQGGSNRYIPFSGIDKYGNIYETTISDGGVQTSQNPVGLYNITATYYPDPFNPPDHVLYVYNTGTKPGRDFANYYFSVRTGLRTGENYVNLLAINCQSGSHGEMTDTGNYVRNVRQPIWNWIMENKKPIRHIVLLYDIPSRITGAGFGAVNSPVPKNSAIAHITACADLSQSLYIYSGYCRDSSLSPAWASKGTFYRPHDQDFQTPFNLPNEYSIDNFSQHTALVCQVNFGSLVNTSGYIDKLMRMGRVSGMYILGTGGNNTMMLYEYPRYLESFTGFYGTGEKRFATTGTKFYRDRGIDIYYKTGFNSTTPYMTGGNLCALASAGSHGFQDAGIGGGSQWPWVPSYCSLNGYNWFVTVNAESYGGNMYEANGSLNASFASPASCMLPTSFSGTNYSNCPVGYVGSTLEPGSIQGIADITFFDLWVDKRPFIECAWWALGNIINSQVICGDPYVIK